MTTLETLDVLCGLYLRPIAYWTDGTSNSLRGGPGLTPVFLPALTAAEQAAFADLQAMAKAPFTAAMTLAEYQTIKPFLATERAFVQQSQADFIALTQNARDRQLFDVVTALIRVQRQMMRDG